MLSHQSWKVDLGGWFSDSPEPLVYEVYWFALAFTRDDLKPYLQVPSSLQSIIAGLELLAQIVVLMLRARIFPHHSASLVVPQLTDNSGAMFVGNKVFTTNVSLAPFAQLLARWAAWTCTSIEFGHIQGEANQWADLLSRGNFVDTGVSSGRRCEFSLQEVFCGHACCQLLPSKAFWHPYVSDLTSPGAFNPITSRRG